MPQINLDTIKTVKKKDVKGSKPPFKYEDFRKVRGEVRLVWVIKLKNKTLVRVRESRRKKPEYLTKEEAEAAFNEHLRRTSRDLKTRAKIVKTRATKSWAKNPGRYDVEGIDTPPPTASIKKIQNAMRKLMIPGIADVNEGNKDQYIELIKNTKRKIKRQKITQLSKKIEIMNRNGKIAVKSPYQPDFVDFARKINGKFDRGNKVWVFDARDQSKVETALQKIYGYGAKRFVDRRIKITPDGVYDENPLWLYGRQIANRFARDSAVRLGEGVIILKGEFTGSAGSSKYPELIGSRGKPVILLIRDIPYSLLVKKK